MYANMSRPREYGRAFRECPGKVSSCRVRSLAALHSGINSKFNLSAGPRPVSALL